jgi:hypothetical protein
MTCVWALLIRCHNESVLKILCAFAGGREEVSRKGAKSQGLILRPDSNRPLVLSSDDIGATGDAAANVDRDGSPREF